MKNVKEQVHLIFVVDVSTSLDTVGSKLNQSLKDFHNILMEKDDFKRYDIYITLITFNELMNVKVDFKPIGSVSTDTFNLSYYGCTNPAPALEYAVNSAREHVLQWKKAGYNRFKPFIFFFTDGSPNECYKEEYEKIAKEIKKKDAEDFVFVAAGYGYTEVENLSLATENVILMERNEEKLEKMFRQLLPRTLLTSMTGTAAQMRRGFRAFNMR